MSVLDCRDGCCHGLLEAQMILMAFMLLVIIVSYLVMLGLVKFAEGVIDKPLPAKLRDAIPLDTNANARAL
jgi:hypothetical protein